MKETSIKKSFSNRTQYHEEETPILDKLNRRNYLTSNLNLIEIQSEALNKYPRAVIFVLASKLFEAFAANGVRTILALFLRDSFCFSENNATVVLHIFNFFSQFCPIFGAILADNYLGNAKTVFYFFFIYGLGYIGIILLMFDFFILPVRTLLISSLVLISIGNGSIRACITTLGGLQFNLPEQAKYLEKYFSYYYFVYYVGILMGKILPPAIRSISPTYEYCFTVSKTYSLSYVAIGCGFLLSWLFFLIGLNFYRHEHSNNSNIFMKVLDCIQYGIAFKLRGNDVRGWIDGSVGRYSETFVKDVKILLNIVKLFMPLSIYWSLLAQQDSSWTFQASQMDTNLFGYYIEPDQIKSIGPILLLFLIPIWDKICQPLLRKCNIKISTFCCITIGGLLAVSSFVCAGLLQTKIDNGLKHNIKISAIGQLPQFVFIMLGEVLLSIPGLQFVYTEAPSYMKSLLTAFWFLNNAIGNLIVIVIKELDLMDRQVWEFYVYGILMLIATIVFIFNSMDYEMKRARDLPSVIITKYQSCENIFV